MVGGRSGGAGLLGVGAAPVGGGLRRSPNRPATSLYVPGPAADPAGSARLPLSAYLVTL